MPLRLFINYRRSDTAPYAGRIFDRLRSALGDRNVFMDVATIRAGADFIQSLRDKVTVCDAFLCLIGPGWLEARNDTGHRRLDDPTDYVRQEIEWALTRGTQVIPILIGGAAMPAAEHLPDSLKPLTRKHAVSVRDDSFDRDMQHVLSELRIANIEQPNRDGLRNWFVNMPSDGPRLWPRLRIAIASLGALIAGYLAQNLAIAGLTALIASAALIRAFRDEIDGLELLNWVLISLLAALTIAEWLLDSGPTLVAFYAAIFLGAALISFAWLKQRIHKVDGKELMELTLVIAFGLAGGIFYGGIAVEALMPSLQNTSFGLVPFVGILLGPIVAGILYRRSVKAILAQDPG